MPRLVTVCRPANFFFFYFYSGHLDVCSAITIVIFIQVIQFQFAHGNFSFTHGHFNFTYGNFNFTYGDFNLLTAISQFYSRQLQFFHGNAHGIFRFAHHLSATAADSGLASKVKTKNLKSIFKVDLQREKVKIKNRFTS